MTRKNTKSTSMRVKVNTGLLLLMTFLFGALSVIGVLWAKMYAKNYSYMINSEAPNLCFENENTDEYRNGSRYGAYICSTEPAEEEGQWTRLTGVEDYTLFLQNQQIFIATINAKILTIILSVIGAIFTLGGLIGTVVYWNHNRSK